VHSHRRFVLPAPVPPAGAFRSPTRRTLSSRTAAAEDDDDDDSDDAPLAIRARSRLAREPRIASTTTTSSTKPSEPLASLASRDVERWIARHSFIVHHSFISSK